MAAPTMTNPYLHPASNSKLIKSANGSKANYRLQPWIHSFWLDSQQGVAYKSSSLAATSALTSSGLLMEAWSAF